MNRKSFLAVLLAGLAPKAIAAINKPYEDALSVTTDDVPFSDIGMVGAMEELSAVIQDVTKKYPLLRVHEITWKENKCFGVSFRPMHEPLTEKREKAQGVI